MVSLVLRKGYVPPVVAIDPPGARTVHTLIAGRHVNPECAGCGRTPMQIQAAPFAACVRPALLPFDRQECT